MAAHTKQLTESLMLKCLCICSHSICVNAAERDGVSRVEGKRQCLMHSPFLWSWAELVASQTVTADSNGSCRATVLSPASLTAGGRE